MQISRTSLGISCDKTLTLEIDLLFFLMKVNILFTASFWQELNYNPLHYMLCIKSFRFLTWNLGRNFWMVCEISFLFHVYVSPRGPLPILLGTDVRLRFSKHPHSYIQYFWKPYPVIYFRWKSWPNHFNFITILWPVYRSSISTYMYSLFLSLVGQNWQIKYSILFYIVAACAKLENEFQR
jgi:hypothetical protein